MPVEIREFPGSQWKKFATLGVMRDMGARPAHLSTSTTSRARPWLVASVAAIAWAAFTMLILHLVSSRDPILDTISSYAYTDRGGGMLEASVLSLAVGSLALLGALVATGTATSRTTRVLLVTWALGLIIAALFPATLSEGTDMTSGRIHQYASLLAFVSLPGVGFSLADRLRELPALAETRALLLRVSWWSVLSLAVFGLSYVLAAFSDHPVLAPLSAALPVGLAQRVALLTDIALLAVMVLLAARAARIAREADTPG
ncbi:Protein of unknown function [Amycolatopsis arida]|uniref:DUF998 domain-containing protein n=2 Tax=Amycolatopsis arida TaxID=587909 RepID=A0A1I5YCU3_9PSEU|nr:uncharacterized protein DUF998 [Amycolatopsis arida]SFQ42051.1 Protein of unknown function [Amycolatopsis arida]